MYDKSFFDTVTATGASSAARIVPHVVEWLRPTSVVDVGCGEGPWLAAFLRAGCTGVGVDGAHVDPARLLVPEECFREHDLEQPLAPLFDGQRFDLAVCLEVGEHLSSGRADGLVDDLCALSDRLLFSAATPGQGGVGHVNEQPHEYWVSRFEGRGYAATTALRRLAQHDDVASWYRQNLLLLVRVTPA